MWLDARIFGALSLKRSIFQYFLRWRWSVFAKHKVLDIVEADTMFFFSASKRTCYFFIPFGVSGAHSSLSMFAWVCVCVWLKVSWILRLCSWFKMFVYPESKEEKKCEQNRTHTWIESSAHNNAYALHTIENNLHSTLLHISFSV